MQKLFTTNCKMAPRSSCNVGDSSYSGHTSTIDEEVRTILQLEGIRQINTEFDHLDQQLLKLMCFPKKTIRQLLAAVGAKDTYNLTRLRFILMPGNKSNYTAETTEDVAIHVTLKLFYEKLFENYYPKYQSECNLAMYYAFRALRSINASSNTAPYVPTYLLEAHYMKLMACQHVKTWSFDDVCRETVLLYPNYFKK